jgi:hypothetical protein
MLFMIRQYYGYQIPTDHRYIQCVESNSVPAQTIAQIAAGMWPASCGTFKSAAQVNRKNCRTVCLVSSCFCLFYGGRAGRNDVSRAVSHARDLPRNERQMPLIESVRARKNTANNFTLTSNPMQASHGTMIETCLTATAARSASLGEVWGTGGLPPLILSLGAGCNWHPVGFTPGELARDTH